MTNSAIRVLRAIVSSEEYIIQAGAKGCQEFQDNGSYTILGGEIRNLRHYKEMVGRSKRTLTGFHRELYRAM